VQVIMQGMAEEERWSVMAKDHGYPGHQGGFSLINICGKFEILKQASFEQIRIHTASLVYKERIGSS
jgi:hypothetical protein